MPLIYRITCEAKNPSRLIDDRSGGPVKIYRGTQHEFQLGLFQDGIAVLHEDANSDSIVVAMSILDSEGNTVSENTSLGSETYTATQWRNGSAQLVTAVLSGANTGAMSTGTHKIYVQAYVSGFAESTNVEYLYADIDIVDAGEVLGLPAEPGPPTAYSQTEADALFALASDMTTAQSDITALEALDVVLYSSQSLSAGEKTQARTNIGAAGVGVTVGSIAGNALDFDSYDTWYEQLTADKTLTATGTVTSSKLYTITLAQDATGGWDIAWPAGFTVNPEAIINPYPSTLTAFQVIQNRVAGGSFAKTIGILGALPTLQDPSFAFDVRSRARLTFNTGTNLSTAPDPYSSETWTYSGTRAIYTASAIRTRAAARMVATSGYILTTAAEKLIDDSIPAGITVACVFTSGGTADARLAHFGPIGLSIDQTGGGIKFGSLSTDANRVSVPFTTNDDIATLAIFVYHAGGGASAYAAKHGLGTKVAYASGAAAATASGNYELFQVSGGTARWEGDVGLIQVWDRAFSWDQVESLAKSLLADFNIVP